MTSILFFAKLPYHKSLHACRLSRIFACLVKFNKGFLRVLYNYKCNLIIVLHVIPILLFDYQLLLF